MHRVRYACNLKCIGIWITIAWILIMDRLVVEQINRWLKGWIVTHTDYLMGNCCCFVFFVERKHCAMATIIGHSFVSLRIDCPLGELKPLRMANNSLHIERALRLLLYDSECAARWIQKKTSISIGIGTEEKEKQWKTMGMRFDRNENSKYFISFAFVSFLFIFVFSFFIIIFALWLKK